jgi:hypothetical protein
MVQCGDHSYAPGGIVCNHLLDGTATEWLNMGELSGNPDLEHDWICPECLEAHERQLREMGSVDLSNFRPACMHCVRRLRRGASRRRRKYELVPANNPEPGRYAGEDPCLQPGDHVKLGFRADVSSGVSSEWMFVEVTAVAGNWPSATYRGELCNRPVFINPARLRIGQRVEFRAEHIYQTIHDSPDRPESEREPPPS